MKTAALTHQSPGQLRLAQGHGEPDAQRWRREMERAQMAGWFQPALPSLPPATLRAPDQGAARTLARPLVQHTVEPFAAHDAAWPQGAHSDSAAGLSEGRVAPESLVPDADPGTRSRLAEAGAAVLDASGRGAWSASVPSQASVGFLELAYVASAGGVAASMAGLRGEPTSSMFEHRPLAKLPSGGLPQPRTPDGLGEGGAIPPLMPTHSEAVAPIAAVSTPSLPTAEAVRRICEAVLPRSGPAPGLRGSPAPMPAAAMPVRVHMESAAHAVAVWVGADAGDPAVAGRLPALIAELGRGLREQGLRLASLTLNGRVVVRHPSFFPTIEASFKEQ